MNFEEKMQRAMDFMVEHQARITANLESASERLNNVSLALDRVSHTVEEVSRQQQSLSEHVISSEKRDRRMAELLVKITELIGWQSSRLDAHEKEITAILSRFSPPS